MAKTTIHSDYIPDNAITSTKIAENSIGAREIATNAITTLYVADGSVTTVKIADDAITSAKLGSALTLGGNTTFSGDIIKDSGTLTLDSPVDLTLDADSGNIFLKDGGTHFGTLQNNSSDFRIVSIVQDKDIIFRGNQGGSFMEAMRIDISAGGTVGIGHNSPSSFSSGANNLVVNDTAGAGGITIVTPNDAKGSIFFADSTSATGQGRIRYNHDGDYMTFGTSGSEDKLVINSAGNVGIGTSSPQKALDIAGASTSGGGVMRLSGTGSASQGDVTGAIQFYNADDTDNTAGVFGMLRGIAGPSGGEGSLQILTDMPSEGADASNITMHFNSNGNVGIGETSPLGKLHIKGTDTGATASAQGNSLILEDTENGLSILSSTAGAGYINFGDSGDNNIGMIIYDHSSNSMRFSANAAERMRIDASGNVGIGTTSPSTPLHVKTNSSGYALTIEENSGGEAYQIGTDQYGGLVFYNSTTKVVEFTDSSEMQLYSGGSVTTKISPSSTSYFTGGNVGIGTTSPTEKLTVAGAVTATGALADDRTSTAAMDFSSGVTRFVSYGDATQDGAIAFRTATGGQSSTERMRIDVNGNVGIGTNSPGGRKLSVQKDTTITSGFNDITEFLDTTIGGGGSVSLNVGRANSTRNLGKMAFKFAGAGSTSNALNFGFYDADNLMTLTAGGSVGIGNSSPGFKLTIGGGIGANSSTAYASMTGQIGFGNDYSDTQRGPNKIVLQNDGAWIAGLGISDNSTDFYSGGNMSFRAGTSLGSERMKIHSNGLIQIDAGANTTGLCINETDVRISNNQTNYGKYKIAAAHVSGGTAHLGRKCANGYSTNALIAEYWGVEEVWAKGAIAYKRISSYDQGEFQWWLNATSSGAEVSSSDTKMRLERTGALHINGSLTQNASDERMKENITLIPNALDKVTQLRGVSFTWKEIENSPHEAGTEDIGVIAQDVEVVLPLIVKPAPFDTYTNTTDEGDEETKETTEVVSRSGKNYKTVEYEKLVPLLIESVKELKTELDAAKARITELEA